jgi:hypothetical protein
MLRLQDLRRRLSQSKSSLAFLMLAPEVFVAYTGIAYLRADQWRAEHHSSVSLFLDKSLGGGSHVHYRLH